MALVEKQRAVEQKRIEEENKRQQKFLENETKRKEKELKSDEEMSSYVDSNRNIAVLLDSSALENERRNTRKQHKETVPSVTSTLFFKQAKYFMKGKQYEKALIYLKKAIEVSDIDDMSAEDGIGEKSY